MKLRTIQKFKIPIFASGDWYSPYDAYEMKLYTNCDGILIARGALHNPFIFKDIKNTWKTIAESWYQNLKV